MFERLNPWLFAFVLALLITAKPAHAAITPTITMNAHNSCVQAVLSTFAACEIAAYEAYVPCPAGSGTVTYDSTYTLETDSCPRTSNGLTSSGSSAVSVHSVGSCPANSTSTGTYTCSCNSGYVDSGSNTCDLIPPVCPATGTALSSGYYDVGTVDDPNNHPPLTSCTSGGCTAIYDGGGQAYRALVGGVYHYFAKGSYSYDSSISGGSCSGGTLPSSASTSLPAPSCGAGQTLISNSTGYSKCYNVSTGTAVDPSSSDAASSVGAKQTAAQAAAGAAAGNAAQAAAKAAGGTDAQAADAKIQAAANAAGQAAADQALQKAQCEQNPNSLSCLELTTPPDAETVPTQTPTFSAASVSFASVAGCPAPVTFNLTMPNMSHSYSISYQPFCDFAGVIRPIFLALAAIAAAFIFAGGLMI